MPRPKLKKIYPSPKEHKAYHYTKWLERHAASNKVGDCTRIIEAKTLNKTTHWIVITYNQRFWSHNAQHFTTLEQAKTQFKKEQAKIKKRAEALKLKRRW